MFEWGIEKCIRAIFVGPPVERRRRKRENNILRWVFERQAVRNEILPSV
jgi:hypothetical protein